MLAPWSEEVKRGISIAVAAVHVLIFALLAVRVGRGVGSTLGRKAGTLQASPPTTMATRLILSARVRRSLNWLTGGG